MTNLKDHLSKYPRYQTKKYSFDNNIHQSELTIYWSLCAWYNCITPVSKTNGMHPVGINGQERYFCNNCIKKVKKSLEENFDKEIATKTWNSLYPDKKIGEN